MAADASELIRAVDLALAGDWEGAHRMVQASADDPDAAWLHAVLHKIEGDEANARYWYRRSRQSYEAYPDPQAELAAIRAALTYRAA